MKNCTFPAVFVILATGVVAQQAQAPAPKPKLSWVAPQAPEVQRLLEVLVGHWKTAERIEANQFLRSGATGSGSFWIRKGPGDNSMILDYTSQSSMGQYASERIIYWDARAGNYRAFYCDSLQPTGCGEAGTGRWEDKDLVFESMTEGPAGVLQMVQRFSNISSDGFTFSLDLVNQSKKERSLTIQARRTGGNAKVNTPDGITSVGQQGPIAAAKPQSQWGAKQAPEVRLAFT